MAMYIPNMKPEQFYDLCKEHGFEIIAIPAADVRPVVKAYWINIWSDLDRNTSMKARCSNCGNTSMRPVGDFCKWCGADMREES